MEETDSKYYDASSSFAYGTSESVSAWYKVKLLKVGDT